MSKKLFLSYKKAIVLLSVVLVVSAGLFFRHHLFRSSIEFWLSYKYKEVGGVRFQYDRASFSKGGVVLHNVSLATKKPGVALQAPKVGFFAKRRKKLSFNFEVNLDRPQIAVHKTGGPPLVSPARALEMLSGPVYFCVEEAKVNFIDAGEATTLYFSLQSEDPESSLGTLYLSDQVGSRQEAKLMAKIYRWSSEWIFELEAEEAKLPWISQLADFFTPKGSELFSVKEGLLSGQCWLAWKHRGELSQLTSNFSVSSLRAQDFRGELGLYLDSFEADVSYPNKRLSSAKGRSFLQSIALKSQLEGANIIFSDPAHDTEFAIMNLAGEVAFNSFRDSKLKLKGLIDQKGHTSPIVISGSPSIVSRDTLDIDLKLLLGPDFPYSTEMNVSMGADTKEGLLVRGKLKDLGPSQVSMFQHMLGFVYPDIKDFEFCEGLLNFEASLRFFDGKIQKILIDNVSSDNLKLYWRSQDILGICSQLSGSAQLDLKALPDLKFPLWEVNIEHGNLLVGGKGQKKMSLSDIDMRLHMCRDVFEPSFISAEYEGIKARIDMVGYYPEADLNVELQTAGDRALAFFQEDMEKGAALKEYLLSLSASLKYKLGSWDVEGSVLLQTSEEPGKGGEENALLVSRLPKCRDMVEFGLSVSDHILQIVKEDTKSVLTDAISKGWFKADHISTRFFDFFKWAFGDDWDVSGRISLDGQFDCRHIDTDIISSNLQVNSPFIDIRLSKEGESDTPSRGSFSFDFAKMRCLGHLPLYQAVCLEKSMGVLYEEIKADLFVDGLEVFLQNIETTAEGLRLGGNLSLNFDQSKMPTLWIETDFITGSTKQVEAYVKHLQSFNEFALPFDGEVEGKKASFSFVYELGVESKEPVWNLDLHLKNGNLQVDPYVHIKDLQFDLSYNHTAKEVGLERVSAKISSEFHKEGYKLISPSITCDLNEDTGRIAFDIRLQDPLLDLAQLVGSLSIKERALELDTKRSHIMGSPVHKVALQFDEECKPVRADIKFPLFVGNVKSYGRILSDFALLPGIKMLTEEMWSGYEGLVELDLTYRDKCWNALVEGKDLCLAGKEIENFYCAAKKQGSKIAILEFLCGDIRAAGFLQQTEDLWKIDSLQITKPGSEIIFSSGSIDPSKRAIDLYLREAEIDLNTFFKVDGRARLEGKVGCKFHPKVPFFTLGADVSFSCEGFSKDNYFVKSQDLMHLSYRPDQGLKIQDTSFVLDSIEDDFSLSCLVPTALINLSEGSFQGYRVHFTLSDKVYTAIKKQSLDYNYEIGDLPARKDRDTEVTIDFYYDPERFNIQGTLPGGVYAYRDYTHKIDSVNFRYDQKNLSVEALIPLFGQQMKMAMFMKTSGEWDTQIQAFQTVDGEVINPDSRVLFVDLNLQSPDGLLVKNCEGSLFGLDFAFRPRPKLQGHRYVKLIGGIDVNAEKLMPLLPEDFAALVKKLAFYKGLRINGDLTIDKRDLKNSKLIGFLEGKDFDFAGSIFKTLLAEVSIDPERIELSNLHMTDEAARAEVPEMKFFADDKGIWQLKIPKIVVSDLRPSLLKQRGPSTQTIKPFFIEELTLEDITGTLNDVNTITGKGGLSFVNTFKRDHNILDVPIEIISRIGLDMVLLVPIQGEMEYVIKNGKLVFTKLKNSFSENKRSYFYLWNKTESFVDFDGNVNIDIRMKQHVLFRITQLFILNVSGSLDQPAFTLR